MISPDVSAFRMPTEVLYKGRPRTAWDLHRRTGSRPKSAGGRFGMLNESMDGGFSMKNMERQNDGTDGMVQLHFNRWPSGRLAQLLKLTMFIIVESNMNGHFIRKVLVYQRVTKKETTMCGNMVGNGFAMKTGQNMMKSCVTSTCSGWHMTYARAKTSIHGVPNLEQKLWQNGVVGVPYPCPTFKNGCMMEISWMIVSW